MELSSGVVYKTKTVNKRGGSTVSHLVDIKGIKEILTERGIWKEFKTKFGSDPILNCKGQYSTALDGSVNKYCCASHRLGMEPDFKNQKPGLEEVVVNSGHSFDLYPKFHCETNWIERYWKDCKTHARKNCDYTFKSLKEKLHKYMDSSKLIHIQRYHNRCWRYIKEYSEGDDGEKVLTQQFKKSETSHSVTTRVDVLKREKT